MSKSKAILVEGKDDESVIYHLLTEQQRETVDIMSKDNDDQLLKSIFSELNVSQRDTLGVVMDGNNNYSGRWQAISQRFNEAGIKLADIPDPKGFISNETATFMEVNFRPIRIGVWIMPNNRSNGELEDFIAKMIPESDPVWPRSQNYIDDIPQKDRDFKDKKVIRAKVHAWLATREEPILMGAAINAEYLKKDGQLCLDFQKWLTELLS